MTNPFSKFAADLCFGEGASKRLDEGRCPKCGQFPQYFRDELSKKEFTISGLCQDCQDEVFKKEIDDKIDEEYHRQMDD